LSEAWVKIFSTYSEAEAYIVKGVLEGEGVACKIKSMRVSQFPLTLNGLGEIKIYVPKESLQKSRDILEAYQKGL
jgi:hypothetical protein